MNVFKYAIFLFIFYSQAVSSEVEQRVEVKTDVNGRKTIEVKESERSEEIEQSDNNAISLFELIVNNPNVPTEVATRTADFIKYLLSKKNIDTDLLYTFVQTLNANLSLVDDEVYVSEMRLITDELRDISYSDKIHYNTNLSNQLRTRMPIIVNATAKLSDTSISQVQLEYLKSDLSDELGLFKEKYVKSSRFQAGLGFSYTYTPIIEYRSQNTLDLSPFAPTTGGGNSIVNFDQEFSNKSYLNFEIAAKLPWIELGLSIPTYSEKSTKIAPVSSELLNGSDDVFAIYQSTIESKLEVEYDFSLRLPILSNYKKWKYKYSNNSQMDYGLMAGLTGFNISDQISTDVRFRTDNTPFNDLPLGENVEIKRNVSFQTVYLGAYYEFEFVDELYMSIDVKWHNNRTSDGSEIDVDGFTTSLRVIYSPTLDFINF
ncbi:MULTISPECIES: hypothetical protein [Pseudoalteromonas]|uniref:hypothetical protein n=1 Tax=Pseudoalteromonas TaxID=53246 RepID=UPI00272CC621|nr:hypothetical protein [Pseudoalteromonas sp.]